MNVLVTGASGYLGRYVVAELLRRGHQVRAMVRPATDVSRLPWVQKVDMFRADLRTACNLSDALTGMDAVVHLAAGTGGSEESQLAMSVRGTERLLDAMAPSGVRRLVFAGTMSNYDWTSIRGTLTEDSPLNEDRIDEQNAYAIAKHWQEKVVRRWSRDHHGQLTVLKPGFIWGPDGHEFVIGSGLRLGSVHCAIGLLRRLPITHVENCADCFVTAIERPQAVGRTYNVVDERPTVWRYAKAYQRHNRDGIRRTVFLPYHLCYLTTCLAKLTSRLVFGPNGRLPTVLTPCRFQQCFKPLRFPNSRLRQELDWSPRYSFQQCVQRTFSASQSTEQCVPAMGEAAA